MAPSSRPTGRRAARDQPVLVEYLAPRGFVLRRAQALRQAQTMGLGAPRDPWSKLFTYDVEAALDGGRVGREALGLREGDGRLAEGDKLLAAKGEDRDDLGEV